MATGVKVKVCGITRSEDATVAAGAGADYLGFIFYTKSPRAISSERFEALRAGLPAIPLVYVEVTPSPDALRWARESGFSCFQVHFPGDYPIEELEAWSEEAGAENLWLAPRRRPGEPFPEVLLPLAGTFLVDTYKAEGFGGSGETGDWEEFRRLADRFPEKNWILAGGLNPDNIAEAVRRSGARTVDVNSGLESSPGRKDAGRIRKLFAELG